MREFFNNTAGIHLIIDVQRVFLDQLAPEVGTQLVGAIQGFIEASKPSLPPHYVVTEDEDMFGPDSNCEGYKLALEIERVEGKWSFDSISRKRASSAFQYGEHSDLHRRLKSMGTQRLFISGLHLPACVLETAIDGSKLGYEVTILKDLCAAAKGFENHPSFPPVNEELCQSHNIGLTTSDKVIKAIAPHQLEMMKCGPN